MVNTWTRRILIGALAVVVLTIGVVGVFAQTDDSATPPAAEEAQAEQGFRFRGFGHGGFGRGEEGLEALAASLGISVEELQAAMIEARATRLEQAVEEGLITREQANLMLAMQALHATIDKDALLAEALGLTVEELQAAKEDGTLRDIVDNIAPAELQASVQAGIEEAIASAVADNVITQEQADLVLEKLAEGDGLGLFGRGGGHGRGRGGPRGNFENAPGAFAPLGEAAPSV